MYSVIFLLTADLVVPKKDFPFLSPCSSMYRTTPHHRPSVRLNALPSVKSFRCILPLPFVPTIPHRVPTMISSVASGRNVSRTNAKTTDGIFSSAADSITATVAILSRMNRTRPAGMSDHVAVMRTSAAMIRFGRHTTARIRRNEKENDGRGV